MRYITIGIDEAGRGPIAGPVYSAALCFLKTPNIEFNDSKKLSEKKREEIFELIKKDKNIIYSYAYCTNNTIDRINILQATRLSMKRAHNRLKKKIKEPTLTLIDGNQKIDIKEKQKTIIGGDSIVPEIMAASIIAKVMRDRYMIKLHKKYPEYNFKKHKGYPTKEHREIVKKIGESEYHRKSFNY